MIRSDEWPDGDSAIMLDGRRMCVDCQCPSRHLEDMRCPRCNQPDPPKPGERRYLPDPVAQPEDIE